MWPGLLIEKPRNLSHARHRQILEGLGILEAADELYDEATATSAPGTPQFLKG